MFPTPMTGDIVRFDRDGSRQVIVTGLFLPTAMIMGARWQLTSRTLDMVRHRSAWGR